VYTLRGREIERDVVMADEELVFVEATACCGRKIEGVASRDRSTFEGSCAGGFGCISCTIGPPVAAADGNTLGGVGSVPCVCGVVEGVVEATRERARRTALSLCDKRSCCSTESWET